MQGANAKTDGKIYGLNDMVKVDCGDCKDCSACCENMGDSIWLDPVDLYTLTRNLNTSFEQLMLDKIELHVTDGVILPNLKMTGERNCCSFLDEGGRCSIHTFRPGICRIFPLGRQYEGERLDYILLQDACQKKQHSKVKVKKWLDTPELKQNQAYLIAWHSFRKQVEQVILQAEDEAMAKNINLFVLNQFFIKPYLTEDFYMEFEQRRREAAEALGIDAEI